MHLTTGARGAFRREHVAEASIQVVEVVASITVAAAMTTSEVEVAVISEAAASDRGGFGRGGVGWPRRL